MWSQINWYEEMIETLKKMWKGRTMVFVGKTKQARDLEFILKIRFSRIDMHALSDINSEKEFYIFSSLNHSFFEKNTKEPYWVLWENYCSDEDIFEFMNNFIAEKFISKEVAIWGLGSISQYFINNFDKVDLKDHIKYYIDSNKHQNEKDGIKIILPKDAVNLDCNIIIAVNHVNYYEIRKQCRELKIDDRRLIYYNNLLENPGDMLRETYNDESYYDVNCLQMDRTLRIAKTGTVYLCSPCDDQPINTMGNMLEENFESVYQSTRAQICRLALLNHTYTFCNKNRCPVLSGIKNCADNTSREAYEYMVPQYPDSISLSVDTNCNLYCQSCRNHVFTESGKDIEVFVESVKEDIVHLPVRLMLNTSGEVFASKYCLNLLHAPETMRRDNIAIYTNGTLLSSEKVDWLLNVYKKLELSISIDAATEETYQKLRRGGDYNTLLKNIEYIVKQKQAGKIAYWQVTFVCQRENIQEMQQFVTQAKQWGVDTIGINYIENWGVYGEEEYQKVSIIDGDVIKEEYRKYFTEELLHDDKVNFYNLANRLGIKAKECRLI